MKGVKEKLFKKLKTIKAIGYLKPERILQVNALDGYFDHTSPHKLNPRLPFSAIQEDELKNPPLPVEEPEIIDVAELMKDLDDQELMLSRKNSDKENVRPMGEISRDKNTDVLPFKRPDINSRTLFDPNLLAAFNRAITDARARETRIRSRNKEIVKVTDPLSEFEERCPPGGRYSVVLYTTSLRGIRKTFEDCQRVRALLENLKVSFIERDISMHSGFKEELWQALEDKKVPPRLFVKGRYVGGAEEVLGLHERGELRPLMEGIPAYEKEGPCEGCVGFRFYVCPSCDGSRKIKPEGGGGSPAVCSDCNENGVIVCPLCS